MIHSDCPELVDKKGERCSLDLSAKSAMSSCGPGHSHSLYVAPQAAVSVCSHSPTMSASSLLPKISHSQSLGFQLKLCTREVSPVGISVGTLAAGGLRSCDCIRSNLPSTQEDSPAVICSKPVTSHPSAQRADSPQDCAWLHQQIPVSCDGL